MHADPLFFPSRRTGTQNSSPAIYVVLVKSAPNKGGKSPIWSKYLMTGWGGGGSICVLYALFWSKMLQIRGVSLIFGLKKSFSCQSGYKMTQYSSPNPARPLYFSPSPPYGEMCIIYTCGPGTEVDPSSWGILSL